MGLIDDVIDGATDTADDVGDAADDVVGGTVEATLDNDVLSVQEGFQYGLGQAQQLGVDISGSGEKMSGSEVAAQLGALTDSAFENAGDRLEGTPVDNPVTDAALWTGDAFVREPAESFVGATTGIEVSETGGSEFEADALDAVNLALTAPALKGGQAAIGAARGGRLSGKLGIPLGAGDDVGQTATSVSDEALSAGEDSAQTPAEILNAGEDATDTGTRIGNDVAESGTTPTDEVIQSGDSSSGNTLDIFNPRSSTRAGEDVAETSAKGSDDTTPALDDLSPATSASDEVVETTARTGDDSGSLIDESLDPLRVGDDGAPQWVDDTARAGEDSAPKLDNLKPADDTAETAAKAGENTAGAADDAGSGIFQNYTKLKTTGLIGGTALGAATVTETFSSDEVPDDGLATDDQGTEYTFVLSRRLMPEKSTRFDEPAALYGVIREDNVRGFWVVFGADEDGNLILLGPNGEKRNSNITPVAFENSLPGAPTQEGQ